MKKLISILDLSIDEIDKIFSIADIEKSYISNITMHLKERCLEISFSNRAHELSSVYKLLL